VVVAELPGYVVLDKVGRAGEIAAEHHREEDGDG
jgi:hypothetical protein